MNIREFSNAVGLIALNYPTVQEYSEGDIYNYLNTGDGHKYPCIFLTIESVEEGELNSQTLTGSLFYVDRLLNDSSNRLMVQTAAISTLKILTGKINDNISGEMEVVSYQPFTEKFADWCAGAFCEFSFTYITDLECGEYDELALNVKENGVYDILGYEKIVVSIPQEGVSAGWVRDYTYSKKETDDKLAEKADKTAIPSLTGYATKTWVQDQGYLTKHQSLNGYATETYVDGKLTGYAKKTEIPSLDGYATETWVDGRLNNKADKNEIPSLTGYATQSWVGGKLAAYAKKTDVPSLAGYATQSWVQDQGYLTQHQSLSAYATKLWVQDQGYLTAHQSLCGYATEIWVNAKLNNYAKLTDIPSLTGYATESWVESKGYLTEHQSLDGYATESWVESKGYLTEHQSLEGYATKDELSQKADKTEIPSLTGYATESWVQNQGYLTEHQSLKTINGQSIVGEGNIEIEGGGVTIEQVNAEIDSRLTGYVTVNDFLNQLDSKADVIYVDDQLAKKANKSDIPSLNGYATESWVQGQGYLTEHQSLENYATKDELAQKSDLSYVNSKLAGKVDSSSIWTGTEAEWNALSTEQKASYTIALVR